MFKIFVDVIHIIRFLLIVWGVLYWGSLIDLWKWIKSFLIRNIEEVEENLLEKQVMSVTNEFKSMIYKVVQRSRINFKEVIGYVI